MSNEINENTELHLIVGKYLRIAFLNIREVTKKLAQENQQIKEKIEKLKEKT